MTKTASTPANGSDAASPHGTEARTAPLDILGDLAMTEIPEGSGSAAPETPGAEADPATTGTAAEGSPTEPAAPEDGDAAGASEAGRVTFSPEQQKVFDARLGKEVAKRKAETDKAEALTAKVGTLESELTRLKTASESAIPLHPEWVEPQGLEAIIATKRLQAEVARLKENWNGIEDEKTPENSMTAQQVQQRYAQATAELEALKPKAQTAWTAAHQQYVDDAKLGRQIREQRAKAAAAAGKTTPATPGESPVTPAGQGAAGRPVTTTPGHRGMSRERFEKTGATREAGEKELAELVAV